MDTELLKTFLEVQRTRHFGQAAENLFLTPSAVSFRIRQLETLMGATLFTRHRNNIQLTGAGERLVGHADAMLLAWKRAQQEVALDSRQMSQLAIAAPANIWDASLQTSLANIGISMPGVGLRAEICAPAQGMKLLQARTIDLLMMFDPPANEETVQHSLFDLDLIMVSSIEGQGLDEALSSRYLRVDWGTAFSIRHAQELPHAGAAILHTPSARIALEFMLQSGGAVYLPKLMVESYLQQKELFAVVDAPVITRRVHGVYHCQNQQLEALQQVVALLDQTSG
ncbi:MULTISPECIES: LysR family transcriptional regulator [Corallincola]|uniref:LysR family transcriptional regulator n=2 Tax=Corallincola TaxID=1775176 RepID=A0ABY1WLH6_9GAMM|nr:MULTISPECIES: LysR family transcriptional regulator [Corallincola]TAA41117.1 LysR family transcriptional regulator [Corallincola spongiicola]TCI02768.1 LysR family transcriptional regulator [Corallincola luteus]